MTQELELADPLPAQVQLEEALRQRTGEVNELARVQGIILNDFQQALNLILKYQRTLRVLASPDPQFAEASKLLTKYRIEPEEPSYAFKIFVDGQDITTHPESREGTAEEITDEELASKQWVALDERIKADEVKWGDEAYGTERAELIRDEETGHYGLRPIEAKFVEPTADLFGNEPEPEGKVDPESRDWLQD